MSEGMYTPPPPPPPPQPPYQQPPSYNPPPPTPPSSGSIDFGKPFTFVFEDPNWLRKILMGGLFTLACVFLVGIPIILGYYARTTRNILAGQQLPLPEWDDIGGFFSEGLRLFGVSLVWTLPVIVLWILVAIPAGLMTAVDSDAARSVGGAAFGLVYCIQIPLGLIIRFVVPVALVRTVAEDSFSAGIQFGRVFSMIKANFVNFLLAFLIAFIAGIAGAVGLIACFIGVIFTAFWSSLVTAHGYAQAYQLSPVK